MMVKNPCKITYEDGKSVFVWYTANQLEVVRKICKKIGAKIEERK